MTGRLAIGGTLAAAALAAAAWLFSAADGEDKAESERPLVSRKVRIAERGAKRPGRQVRTPKARPLTEKKISLEKVRQDLMFSESEDRELSEIAKAIFREIQEAFDRNDFTGLRRALAKIGRNPDGTWRADAFPASLRKRLVSSLGWFGAEALPELIDFLTDADPEVQQTAFDQFIESLSDFELSDYERSKIVIAAAKALSDEFQLDYLYMEIGNMRNSVKGDTIVKILTEGGESAVKVLLEQLEFYTDCDVKTAEQVKQWMADNPDDEFDNDFYGPPKN